MNLNQRIFNGTAAESEISDQLEDADVAFDHLGFDYYDNSIEVHGVPTEYRLSDQAHQVIKEAGFAIAYLNHVDKWETHYSLHSAHTKYWRVSYPHKRNDGDDSIWLEEKPPESWNRFKTTIKSIVDKCIEG